MKIYRISILSALVFLGSCGSTPTVYERFVLWPSLDVLLAHDPKNDLPLRLTCDPTAEDQAPCIALKRQVFYDMEKELFWLREQNNHLQIQLEQVGSTHSVSL